MLIIYYLIFVMAICIAISYALIVLFEVNDQDISNLELMFKLIILNMLTVMTITITFTRLLWFI